MPILNAQDFKGRAASTEPTITFSKGGSVLLNMAAKIELDFSFIPDRLQFHLDGTDLHVQKVSDDTGFKMRPVIKESKVQGMLLQSSQLVAHLTKALDWPFKDGQKKSVRYTIINLGITDNGTLPLFKLV